MMSGWIRHWFTPRWQHTDPRVRRRAAEKLDHTHHADVHRLLQLAQDPDGGVRQAALSKLNDASQLLALHDTEHGSPELRHRLAVLLTGSEAGGSLEERLELVAQINDATLLGDIAFHGDNQQLRLAALARITDEDALIEQACTNGIAAVRHAAATRVTSEEGLRQLVRRAKRDKQVVRLARERLNRKKVDSAQLEAAKAKREQLLHALEEHARTPWEPLYAGRYRHLQREWEKLGDLPSADQEHRYQEACLKCRKTITDHEAQQHAHEAADQRREDADHTREELIDALEETLAGLRRETHLSAQDIASLRSQKQLLATRWQKLSDHHAPDDSLRERYDHALADYDHITQAWERYKQRQHQLQQALNDDDRDALQQQFDACQWPSDLPPTKLLDTARHRLQPDSSAEKPETSVQKFSEDLHELGQLLDKGAFKSASRLYHTLRHQLEQLPTGERHAHEVTLKRLGAQLAELRDWRSFVAGPKRVQLHQAITELADDQRLSEQELDRRHRQLVKEWKALGDAAADRELSREFRAASDRLHERLRPWKDALAKKREQHLEARRQLCEQLEQLLQQPDPHADPDALREIRDRAREQWRHHSPVPRDHAEAIGRRFGRLRHELQALIDRRAQEIASAKQALIDEATSLLNADMPATKQAERVKELQQRWRTLGRAAKGEEQQLWKEFRSVCDRIFASRDAERENRSQRVRERLETMQALIDRLDTWQPSNSRETHILEQAIAEAEEIGPLPTGRRAEGMRRRWSGIVRARRERLARLAVSEEVERWQNLYPLLERHLSADKALLDDGEEAIQVTPPDDLEGDMLVAHQRRNAARLQPPTSDDVENALIRLRVHLALLAGSRIGQQDEPLRLAIQVERINDNLGRDPSKADELHDVLRELLATGPVPADLWAREAPELDAHLTHLLRMPPP
ncbi:DUF349 domain-containing protein [Aidingimonas halophila]|uniref:DUF349 domain-containing protein n=1 Tax=Aidingimonas halophila TaxID=574349 RepID=A0A1H2VVT2_9GAMM|nr:DUF349 domain-containing protein [Aidingimonas halophila]GHC24858.1 hypothetical protein GCM10008094_15040 [Aidingimonas halophila]SDW72331.1 protein of unknown function [Aidingimonas halophila]